MRHEAQRAGAPDLVEALEIQLAETRERVERLEADVRELVRRGPGAPHAPLRAPDRARETIELPAAGPRRGEDWLRDCQGFWSETTAGQELGWVEEVRFGRRHDRPDALAILVRRFPRRLLLVPAAAVASVVPEEQRLVIDSDATARPRSTRRRLLALLGRTRARVVYTIMLAGKPALTHQIGIAVRTNSGWQVGDQSFCALLALQGAPPPACAGAKKA